MPKGNKRLVVAMSGTLAFALVVAMPLFPIWLRIAIWVVLVVMLLSLIGSYIPAIAKLQSGNNSHKPMTILFVVLVGAISGAISAPIIWLVLPPDEPAAHQPLPKEEAGKPAVTNNNGATEEKPNGEPEVAAEKDRSVLVISKSAGPTTVAMSPLIPNPNQKPLNPTDLDFYFFALMSAAFDDKVQYATITVTNRTPQKMHLELWWHVDYWTDSGEPRRTGGRADWNPDGLKEGTGEDFIELEGFETKHGRILLSLGKPGNREISKWFLSAGSNVYIEVFDTVTGNRSAFKPSDGYPAGQMPAPLPSHKLLLALDFPKTPAADSQSLPPARTGRIAG